LLPWVAPPSYASAYLVIILLMPGQAFIGIHFYGETLLGAVRRTRILGMLNTLSAALCTGLNFLCIPFMGWYGAALATNTSAILVDSVEVAIGLKHFQLTRHVEWGRVLIVCTVFLVQLLVALMLRDASAPVFFAGTGACFVASAVFLYFGPFCSAREKTALRGAASRIGSVVAARMSPS
jgi:O-antigen/teichoic acid export membrane protein